MAKTESWFLKHFIEFAYQITLKPAFNRVCSKRKEFSFGISTVGNQYLVCLFVRKWIVNLFKIGDTGFIQLVSKMRLKVIQ